MDSNTKFKYFRRASLGGAGIQTAALAFGGNNPGFTTAVESYNGTSWTTVTSMGIQQDIIYPQDVELKQQL
jgi:hypothetical protein